MDSMAPPPDGHTTETIETAPRRRWRSLAATATATVVVAAVVGVGLASSGGASPAATGAAGQEPTSTTAPDRPDGEERDGQQKAGSDADRDAERAAQRTERLSEALQSLVDDGTITDAQRDAVVAELVDTFADRRPGHPGKRFGFRGPFGLAVDTAAEALGVTADDLRSALRDGKSVADVAAEQGVEVDAVIDALVTEAKAKLAELDLPDDRPGPTDEQLRAWITRAVNGEGRFGHRFGGGHGHGHGPGPR